MADWNNMDIKALKVEYRRLSLLNWRDGTYNPGLVARLKEITGIIRVEEEYKRYRIKAS